jgi:dedicated sortase system histidine kinase
VSLRRQLLALSLVLLALPWAGCEFLRETERTLRAGQALAVEATADAIAIALGSDSALLYPAPQRRFSAQSTDWYIPTAGQPLIADGYDDDWREQPQLAPLTGTAPDVELRAAVRAERVFLLLRIPDDSRRYFDPSVRPAANGDRLELHCQDLRDRLRVYRVSTAAPGLVRARGADPDDTYGDRIRGTWRELPQGYLIELQMPLNPHCARLGLRYIDAGRSGERSRLDTRAGFRGELPSLVYRIAALEERLAAYRAPGRYLTVRDRHGWVVAQLLPAQIADADATVNAAAQKEVFWLLRWLYRSLLDSGDADAVDIDADLADGTPAAPRGSVRRIRAAAMIPGSLGDLQVAETTERYLALTDQTTARVVGIGAAVLAVALLGLLGYASLLSWRVRRLRDAALDISAERRSAADFPRSRAADELGDLSRSYADLLRQIDEYNRYLRGLARSLSHELRTPIAIIASSLEHLAQDVGASAQQRGEYVERSRAGLTRLTRIVNAMAQVSRLEESLASAEQEHVDLRALLRALCAAYADTWPDRHFTCDLGGDRAEPAFVSGSGDLLAQAMDKLVDNAVSFTPQGETINLALETDGAWAIIHISNPGPALPESLREHLFEPLISLRESRDPNGQHLGLGLFIARAIAEHHGGSLQGANRADGCGVTFSLRLPLRA